MLVKVYSDENEDDDKQRTRFIKIINFSLWLSLLKYSLLLETCIIFICIRSKDPNFNFRFPHLGIRVRIYCNTLLINPYLSLKANKLDGPSDETGKPEVVWHYKSPYHKRRTSALHRQWRRLYINEIFSSGTLNNIHKSIILASLFDVKTETTFIFNHFVHIIIS